MKAKTKGSREELERKYGIRYSVLLELHYFDPVRMTILDPMHNLFLGSAKHMLKIWNATKILRDEHLGMIQEKIELIQCPSDVGKLPQKFSSFGSFTADQWKNWTILFSVFALKDVLKSDDLECWRAFFLACKNLCTRTMKKSNVKLAQKLLLSFCERFEKLYGEDRVTPNMHMHAHLDQCINDFGPIYSFWLFSFERENGILGSMPINRRNIEIQLMRKFIKNLHSLDIVCNLNILSDFGSEFNKLFGLDELPDRGTLSEMSRKPDFEYIKLSSRNVDFQNADWRLNDGIEYPSGKSMALTEVEVKHLFQMYGVLYPNIAISAESVCISYRSVRRVSIYGSILGTKHGRSYISAMILAHWSDGDCKIAGCNAVDLTPRPGQIEKLLLHNLFVNGKMCLHLIAKVIWFTELDESLKNMYGKPVEVWRSDSFEREGPAVFIPVQRIKSKFVYAYKTIKSKKVIIVCPRDRYLV
ncbi:hypothetical protein ACJMK2_012908 [Sinanodonta woodiana]|uniref:Transposase n=2 Tax=Sinanodonta woodiana TaxID=1069815 RepID=A0ABD3V9Q9_SINWO